MDLNTMIIPVIDLKDGEAVSGKSGMRKTYKPIKSVFYDSSDPIGIARALKDAGFTGLYVADLDAIDGNGSNLQVAGEMNHIIPVMLDSGVNTIEGVEKVLDTVEKVIIATETLKSLDDIELIFSSFNKENIVMSVDIKDGKVLGKHIKTDFKDIIKKIEQIKPVEVILLDISRVGTGNGVDRELINSFIGLETELILGGGVTDQDIKELNEMGVQNFLVGTSLHAGIFNHTF
jgi:phosphoribosylformimino-5-aminoimidazole carboxamide ribotide isomerase